MVKNSIKPVPKGDRDVFAVRCRMMAKHLGKPDLKPEILYWYVRGRHDGDVCIILGLDATTIEAEQEKWLAAIFGDNRPSPSNIRENLWRRIGSFGNSGGVWLNPALLSFSGEWEDSPFAAGATSSKSKTKPKVKKNQEEKEAKQPATPRPKIDPQVSTTDTKLVIAAAADNGSVSPGSGGAKSSNGELHAGVVVSNADAYAKNKPKNRTLSKAETAYFPLFVILYFARQELTVAHFDLLMTENLKADPKLLGDIGNKIGIDGVVSGRQQILDYLMELWESPVDLAPVVQDLDYSTTINIIGNFLSVSKKDISNFLEVVSPSGRPIFERVNEAMPFAMACNQRLNIAEENFSAPQSGMIGGGIRHRLNTLKSRLQAMGQDSQNPGSARVTMALQDLRRQMDQRQAVAARE